MRRTRCSRTRGGIVLLAVMGLLVGAPSAPAKVTGPNLTFDPATFNFGSSPQAFTLTNSGDTATGAIVVSSSGASNYTLGPDGCTGKSLGPGKSCSVTVSFTPPAPCGIVTATLTATAPKLSASAALTGGAACPAVSAALSATPSCAVFGYDVNLIASASGGTEPYTFTFTEGDTPLGANTSGILNVSFPALGSHTYSVTATDDDGITSLPATASATVPAPLEVSISETRGDGTVDLSADVSGGAPPFSFGWSNGDTGQVTTVPKPVDDGDTYQVTVIDSLGCFDFGAWTVTPDPT
jgi:hypothetical protein